jgi:hypothetical protein
MATQAQIFTNPRNPQTYRLPARREFVAKPHSLFCLLPNTSILPSLPLVLLFLIPCTLLPFVPSWLCGPESIMQNKPNVKMGKINISTATLKTYANKQRTMNNERYSKQTQSNPILPPIFPRPRSALGYTTASLRVRISRNRTSKSSGGSRTFAGERCVLAHLTIGWLRLAVLVTRIWWFDGAALLLS